MWMANPRRKRKWSDMANDVAWLRSFDDVAAAPPAPGEVIVVVVRGAGSR